MIFWRVRADMPFTEQDEADDFYHDCLVALPKTHTINPGTGEEERAHIVLQKCMHDETPLEPCPILEEQYGPD